MVFSISGPRATSFVPEMSPFGYDAYYCDDTRRDLFRASADTGLVRGYKEHGYYFSGIQT